MSLAIVLCLFVSLVEAQTNDELDTYIRQFQAEALPEAPIKRMALFKLGSVLFKEVKLSGKKNISCLDCHSDASFSSDGLPLGLGEGAEGVGRSRHQLEGNILPRHTQSLYNLGLPGVQNFFWDGRVREDWGGGWNTPEPLINGQNPELQEIASTFDSLFAVQSIFPIANPDEMLGKESLFTQVEAWEAAMERLFKGEKRNSYKALFKKAFPGVTNYNIAHVGNALAEFQRHNYLANKTPWDLYIKGEKKYMTERMKKGAKLFMTKATCFFCHQGPHLSTFGMLNIGIPQIGPGKSHGDDKGRSEITNDVFDDYTFRIAPLRNIALTAPYMHSGVFSSLREVINHYNNPQDSFLNFTWNPKHPQFKEDLKLFTDPTSLMRKASEMTRNMPRNLELTQDEKDDLLCFLTVGLTDLSYQHFLKGKVEELEDCSPVHPDEVFQAR